MCFTLALFFLQFNPICNNLDVLQVSNQRKIAKYVLVVLNIVGKAFGTRGNQYLARNQNKRDQ